MPTRTYCNIFFVVFLSILPTLGPRDPILCHWPEHCLERIFFHHRILYFQNVVAGKRFENLFWFGERERERERETVKCEHSRFATTKRKMFKVLDCLSCKFSLSLPHSPCSPMSVQPMCDVCLHGSVLGSVFDPLHYEHDWSCCTNVSRTYVRQPKCTTISLTLAVKRTTSTNDQQIFKISLFLKSSITTLPSHKSCLIVHCFCTVFSFSLSLKCLHPLLFILFLHYFSTFHPDLWPFPLPFQVLPSLQSFW